MTMTDIDEQVDTTPPDTEPPVDGDGEEWHGMNITAVATDQGDYVEIESCPELSAEQMLRLVDRVGASLLDYRQELVEEIGQRS